jgi:predicted GIY-YIG superfamily endonuclease
MRNARAARALLPDRQNSPRGTVYLLCFDRPYRHAGHYLGWTQDLDERLDRHSSGGGAVLLAAAHAAGITWICVRTWPDVTRRVERWLKNKGSAKRICPRCFGSEARGTLEGMNTRRPQCQTPN